MEIQSEREAFERLPDINAILHNSEFGFNEGINQYYHPSHAEHRLSYAFLMGAWVAWQAAKAQTIPEGFVLINAESLALHAQSIRMFNNGEEEDDYYEIENHVCAIEAMIEAQEQK